jgi:hypothetical protein
MEQVSLVHGIEEAQVSLVHSIEDGTEKCPLMICTSIIKRPLCVEVAELREPHAHTKTAPPTTCCALDLPQVSHETPSSLSIQA